MDYPKTAQKWNRPQEEIRALVDLVQDRSWRVLKEIIETITQEYTRTLENSNEVNDMLRAQGAKKIYKKLENEVLIIVDAAKREINGEEV